MRFNPLRAVLKTLYVLDKVANKLTLGKEWETISSRMGKCLLSPGCPSAGKATSKFLCSLLDRIDKNHCVDSIETEMMARGAIVMSATGLKERGA